MMAAMPGITSKLCLHGNLRTGSGWRLAAAISCVFISST